MVSYSPFEDGDIMIGRKKERDALLSAEKAAQSGFVAIYGRRRIGKTFLVRETFGERLTFCHAGVENVGMRGQLRAFSSSLKDFGWQGGGSLKDWFDAFDALKDVKHPDVKESEEFKKLQSDFDAYKAMQTARTSDDFKSVKPKFFETVYGMVDRSDGAKPVADQLSEIAGKYEEYFSTAPAEQTGLANPAKPSFGAPTEGSAPTGKTGPSFNDFWKFPEGKK